MADKVYVSGGSCSLGTDPELFLLIDGKVTGSEKIVPAEGLNPNGQWKVEQDGVQIELHPAPSHCRQTLATYIGRSMNLLAPKLQALKDAKISFAAAIKIDKAELDSLGDKAKMFGCAPSQNAYKTKGNEITVNAATYTKRHAGGHLHFGLHMPIDEARTRRQELVPFLDAFVGNTCVLLDRDPAAAERRQHYGRAGEYRLPVHGLEYRTLSNFWMRSYQLMSLVFGMGRQMVGVWSDSVLGTPAGYDYTKQPPVLLTSVKRDWNEKFLKLINLERVEKAINTNDLDLAYANWEDVKKFITDYINPIASSGVNQGHIPILEYFAKKIQEEGIEYWFPQDPFEHWCSFVNGKAKGPEYQMGWETYSINVIASEMRSGKHHKFGASTFGSGV